ncbi:MAG TPA: UDP-glucose/GDP-mannose dehydrogenase family protein [Acidimicrobiales bacterium]|nr:UDP-glucose/GDP-mannose dehydrogenase family protein [Acidimicrobiales bacterium]
MADIAVIGTGYVGLTTGAYLAHLGHNVVCADVVPEKVEALNRGEVPIHEAGLDEMVEQGIEAGRLSFVLGAVKAAAEAEFIFLCLPTPQGEDGSADLSYVEAVARELGPHIRPESIVVNKSTVPVGSNLRVAALLNRDDVFVVSNPEFLREGQALQDSLNPDRIVIGANDQEAALRLAELYESLHAPVLVTDPASAETIKYAANAFLATKVSFINAVAHFCELVGADIKDVALGMGQDKRIGFEFLRPGPGWGGSCFPKDSRALIHMAEDRGYGFDLLRSVVAVNDEQYERVADKIAFAAGGSLEGKTIAVWGLTFKARTDDTRESPALFIIERLLARGAKVQAFDPMASRQFDDFTVCDDAYAAVEGAAALAVLTEWEEFRFVDLTKVRSLMAGTSIVDARNLLDPVAVRRHGFTYDGIGRL